MLTRSGKQCYPPFSELRKFVAEKRYTTICEIRDRFNGNGNDTIYVSLPGRIDKVVVAYCINVEFFRYLRGFMRQKYVKIDQDNFTSMFFDTTYYTGRGRFVPIVLSIIDS